MALAMAYLRRFEGLRLRPYVCPGGAMTIGYGHAIRPGEDFFRGGVDKAVAEAVLTVDVFRALWAVHRVGQSLSVNQAAALASLVFNIGESAWEQSTIRRKVAAGDFAGAANEFSRWVYAGGKRLDGLVKRRGVEAELFRKES
ncbi:MAG: lysozyme [Desulfobulbus sp.]|nr:lysozyme [Desulfobulbus sp.]